MRQAGRRPGDVNPAAAAGQVQGTANRRDEEEDAATGAVTIGQALRAVALSPAGDRPVDHADAAAVQAAEESATGHAGAVVPGGVAAVAQRAAETNTRPPEEARGGEEEGGKAVTLRDVLGDAASAVVPGDRAVTWVDAEKAAAASSAREGGGMGEVADAVAAAAQMNEGSPL